MSVEDDVRTMWQVAMANAPWVQPIADAGDGKQGFQISGPRLAMASSDDVLTTAVDLLDTLFDIACRLATEVDRLRGDWNTGLGKEGQ